MILARDQDQEDYKILFLERRMIILEIRGLINEQG